MKRVTLSLTEAEAKLLLEAVATLEAKWADICESSSDEDEIAEYGNDLTELRLLSVAMKEEAMGTFGQGVMNFSREAL
jgi:hypothetical protein